MTATEFAPVVGQPIVNGAIILRAYQDSEATIVLCRRNGGELATWRLDKDGNACWGHYFDANEMPKAVKNFFERVNVLHSLE